MILAHLDLHEQLRHLVELMAALLQPVLWLLLCIGFVLASAHLLTMLATRWGDRRTSPKAFLFSLAVHLSLGVAVIALIPEYRQHILSLGKGEPTPMTVELVTRSDEPQPSAAGAPAWERIPDQLRMTPSRSEAIERPPVPDETPPRPAAIQLADARPVEAPAMPAAPVEEPQPAPLPRTEASPERAPAEASLATPEIRPPEARPDPQRPQPPRERAAAPMTSEPEEQTGQPPTLESLTERPPARLVESPLAALTSPQRMEAPPLTTPPATPPADLTRPVPVPLAMDVPSLDSRPSDGSAGRPAMTGAPRTPRTRSAIATPLSDAPVEITRAGLMPVTPDILPPNREPAPLPRRNDAALPDLYRPDADPSRTLAALGIGRVPASYGLRTDQERKDEAIRKFGGTEDSQKAVERALRWLVSVQEADGRWKASRFGAGHGPREANPENVDRQHAGRDADTGITALVVLALLGNGNSVSSGPYSVNVDRAINWLTRQQLADGSLAGSAARFEAMYCHGMATLALAEAYAMEQDAVVRASLRHPLERALSYSSTAQLEDGGWRYMPRQLGGGDMSIFGWQLMAYRSAQDGGLPMPERTRSAMISFLRDRSRGSTGGLAGYRADEAPTPTMTAEALFCKQMLGLKRDNPMAGEAVGYLLQHRPRLADLNLYYWYYGTLAMFQFGGREWELWNDSLRDLLVNQQVADGPYAGSWEPRDLYSRYGGRLFSTAVATLCLEVYYRRLPMYQWATPADR